jgi:hypothetical protein
LKQCKSVKQGHIMDQGSVSTSHKQKSLSKPILMVVVAIVFAAAFFVGGMKYQKGKDKTSSSSTAFSRTGFGGGQAGSFGGRQMDGSIGTVTAISSSSISVQDQRTSSTKTYNINSSTQITDSGSTVSYSSISTGDTVLVRTSSSTSTTAETIMVNPSFGGGGALGNGQSGSQTENGATTTE